MIRLTQERLKEIGRASYEAFRQHENKHFTEQYPTWDELPEVCREANCRAAEVAYRMGEKDASTPIVGYTEERAK